MSNIDELPDLAGDVSTRVVPPAFDEVTHRVRARRGRRAAGTIAATALVVGALALWQNVSTTASSNPAPSISQPADPAYPAGADWQQVVDGTDSHPYEVAGGDDGSVAIVWRALEQSTPAFALVIRNPDGTDHGRVLDAPIQLTTVPGGWIGVRTTRAWFVDTDGTWTDLGTPLPGRAPRPGDVLVRGRLGLWLYSTQDHSWSTMSFDGLANDLWVTAEGFVLTCAAEGQDVVVRLDAHEVARAVGDSCTVAGRRDSLVVVVTGDAADGSVPINKVLWSDDGGQEWGPIAFAPGSFNSVTVLEDGTPAIGTDGGAVTIGLFRSSEPPHGVVFSAGQRLYSLAYGQSTGAMSYTDDKGDTWRVAPVPGMESSEQ
ncbi:MAG: hypothetical protein ABIO16_15205 [Nocardioides sp.]